MGDRLRQSTLHDYWRISVQYGQTSQRAGLAPSGLKTTSSLVANNQVTTDDDVATPNVDISAQSGNADPAMKGTDDDTESDTKSLQSVQTNTFDNNTLDNITFENNTFTLDSDDVPMKGADEDTESDTVSLQSSNTISDGVSAKGIDEDADGDTDSLQSFSTNSDDVPVKGIGEEDMGDFDEDADGVTITWYEPSRVDQNNIYTPIVPCRHFITCGWNHAECREGGCVHDPYDPDDPDMNDLTPPDWYNKYVLSEEERNQQPPPLFQLSKMKEKMREWGRICPPESNILNMPNPIFMKNVSLVPNGMECESMDLRIECNHDMIDGIKDKINNGLLNESELRSTKARLELWEILTEIDEEIYDRRLR